MGKSGKTILIINPPSPESFQANRDFMGGFGATNAKGVTRVPSLAAAYVTGALKHEGFDADMIDLAVENDPERIVDSIGKPPLIGLHCGTATFKDDLRFADRVKQKTGAFIFMFGPQVSVTPEYAKAHSSLDAVICGEPEFASVDLAKLIIAGESDLSDIKGLWWCKDGIVKNPPRPFEKDLDRIPFPYRNAKYTDRYFYRDGETPFITILASRGCPYDCVYCPYPVSQGTKFRARTPQNVIDELLYEKKRVDYKMVLFRDPVFSFNRERTIELCRLLKENVSVMWRCETACLNVDNELLDIMKASGCIGINFGIETGSPSLIGRYAKKTGGLDRIKSVFAHCRKIGMGTIGFFMVGLPGETRKTMRETLKFAIEIDPAEVNFTTATPFPGTALNKMMRETGKITGDEFEDFRIYGCVTGVQDMKPEEVRSELIKMYLAFYLRPQRLITEISKNPIHFLKKSFSMLFLLMKR
ncbi:MAG: radical SAM protein [Candidatus Omnitrophica bacterium]|nr:radical SAM protein [Candidatus Omnitrophota bacterium]